MEWQTMIIQGERKCELAMPKFTSISDREEQARQNEFFDTLAGSPRQNYLYLRAEFTRPCVCEASGTGNYAPQCYDEAFTREKPTSANSRGDDEPIRSADVRTEVNKIMTRFAPSTHAGKQ
jgi:hypothetical protein